MKKKLHTNCSNINPEVYLGNNRLNIGNGPTKTGDNSRFLFVNSFFIAVAFLGLTSCRSTDTDNNLNNGGVAQVAFNLTGTDFAEQNRSPQPSASLKTGAAFSSNGNSGSVIQQKTIMLSPSSFIQAELAPAENNNLGTAKVNALAAVNSGSAGGAIASAPGASLTSGMKFRIIAYKAADGTYVTHKDYTVGQPADGLILEQGTQYTFVAYSFGSTSALPTITSGETTNLSSAQVAYDNTNRDFMYQKMDYTPSQASQAVPFTLRHKLTQMTVTINSYSSTPITAIGTMLINPHYSSGTFPLSTGNMINRGASSSNQTLSLATTLPAVSITTNPIILNADTSGALTGNFQATNITINGETNTINPLNAFKITPETNSTLTINLKRCGAYIGPNTNPANFKEFACQNLGATAGIDPFSPVAGNHGLKVQWGRNITGTNGQYYYTQTSDQANSGTITGWSTTNAADGAWNSGTEASPIKTVNDPCPSGYRVPTRTEWQAVIDNNTNIERVGTWADNGNYTTALYFRNPSNVRTLMLPAAGYRLSTGGALYYRGNGGYYWSSSVSTSNASRLYFYSSSVDVANTTRAHGFSVRCIAE
ncbi:FISUMP domain-containing protein [Elizabethkingia anophelis]|uniref:FISUMP domain-containing protein n=1 Tax=Elizabethkingia anophelis TaxID=1117645 RepID=UPI0037870066